MREVDPRSKFSRRFVLKASAATIPAVAAAGAVAIDSAWADGGALKPSTMKTLVKMARDIYPHDFLGDSVYITAVKPWNDKAAADPATKTMLENGVLRLDLAAQDKHQSAYNDIGWGGRPCRAAARHRGFGVLPEGPLRPRRVHLQPARYLAEVRLRGLVRRQGRLHPSRLQRHRLAPQGVNAPGQQQKETRE